MQSGHRPANIRPPEGKPEMPDGIEIVRVRSKDRTLIGFARMGVGPPLVLVHGGAALRSAFDAVVPFLARRFTLYVVDRRGRGSSEDSVDYTLEREFEDIAAVVESAPSPTFVFGHSFGADVALGAALLSTQVAKLVLYEGGGLLAGIGTHRSEDDVRRIEDLLLSADRQGALIEHLRSGITTSHDVEILRSLPSWPDRVAIAGLLPREIRGRGRYVPSAERLNSFRTPTLIVTGERSGAARRQMERLALILPSSRLVVLSDQGHHATVTAPELLASCIVSFLETPSG